MLFRLSESYRSFLLAADKCYVTRQIRECKLSIASSFVDENTVEVNFLILRCDNNFSNVDSFKFLPITGCLKSEVIFYSYPKV